MLFKNRKIVKVRGHIHLKNILFFRVSLGCLNFKVILMIFSRTDLELLHIQNAIYTINPVNIPCETLAY